MSSRFEIVVQGIDDPQLVAEIEQTIRNVFQELALPGSWHVSVKPSPVSGRWDFNVHGVDVRHALSIAVPPNLLPTLIPRRLEESLNVLRRRKSDGRTTPTVDLASDLTVSTVTPVPSSSQTQSPERNP